MISLIVGLGNPGAQYAKTRHNVGAWFVDHLADHTNLSLAYESKFFGFCARLDSVSHPCWLLKPSTYMNESGKAVAALANFYKIPPQSILVVHDELDFPAGIVRFKEGGGHGGHNGLRNIIQCLGTSDFCRIRIGIGHPGQKDKVHPYVLNEPSRADKELIENAIDSALQAVPKLMSGEFQKVYQYLHS